MFMKINELAAVGHNVVDNNRLAWHHDIAEITRQASPYGLSAAEILPRARMIIKAGSAPAPVARRNPLRRKQTVEA